MPRRRKPKSPVVKAVEEINDKLKLNPPIETDMSDEELKDEVLDVSTLIEADDEFSIETLEVFRDAGADIPQLVQLDEEEEDPEPEITEDVEEEDVEPLPVETEPETEEDEPIKEEEPVEEEPPKKRKGRGRPKGAKNKNKQETPVEESKVEEQEKEDSEPVKEEEIVEPSENNKVIKISAEEESLILVVEGVAYKVPCAKLG